MCPRANPGGLEEGGAHLMDHPLLVQRWKLIGSDLSTSTILNTGTPVSQTGTTGDLLYGMYGMATVLAVKIPSNCLPSKYHFTHPRPGGNTVRDIGKDKFHESHATQVAPQTTTGHAVPHQDGPAKCWTIVTKGILTASKQPPDRKLQ